MSAAAIAQRHLEAELAEAGADACGADTIGCHMIDAGSPHFLKPRAVEEVSRELPFIADTVEPQTIEPCFDGASLWVISP
jgi:hypothetical protein